MQQRIVGAALACGRDPDSITLVAVSKTHGWAQVAAAHAAGLRVFGESRVQEAAEKFTRGGLPGLELHLVGHLQSNKARLAVELFDCIHSLDSLGLLARLERVATELSRRLAVFVQLTLAGESSKHGLPPGQLPELLGRLADCRWLRLAGLMTIPPWDEDPEAARPWFRRLRELAEAHGVGGLSMGMSHDLEVAIEEGATHVRVGQALFGPRPAA